MNAPNNDSPDNKIHAKLQAVAEAMATRPPWFGAWKGQTRMTAKEILSPNKAGHDVREPCG